MFIKTFYRILSFIINFFLLFEMCENIYFMYKA